jgi:hypothetical protein
MATKMFAPAALTGIVQGAASGTSYTIGTDGSISANVRDVLALEAAGFTQANRTSNASNGLSATNLPLIGAKNADGTTLAASAASGKFGLALTFGTSEVLVTEAANNNAKSDAAIFEYVLPASYVAAQDITLTVQQQIVIGSGTLSVKTLTPDVRKKAVDGTISAASIASAAQNMTNAAGDLAFTITGTTLSPGDLLMIELTAAITETAASAVTAKIQSVRLS